MNVCGAILKKRQITSNIPPGNSGTKKNMIFDMHDDLGKIFFFMFFPGLINIWDYLFRKVTVILFFSKIGMD